LISRPPHYRRIAFRHNASTDKDKPSDNLGIALGLSTEERWAATTCATKKAKENTKATSFLVNNRKPEY
jgi:hypothetical protein